MITEGKGAKNRPLVLRSELVEAMQANRLSMITNPLWPIPRWDHDGPNEFYTWKGVKFTESDTSQALSMCGWSDGQTTFVSEEFTVIESGLKPDGRGYYTLVSYRDSTQRMIDGGYRPPSNGEWRPGRDMPAWMSRYDVTFGKPVIKRVQAVTDDEIKRLGFRPETAGLDPENTSKALQFEFRSYWDTYVRKRLPAVSRCRYELNPWTWLYPVTFKFVEPNVRQVKDDCLRRGLTSTGSGEDEG